MRRAALTENKPNVQGTVGGESHCEQHRERADEADGYSNRRNDRRAQAAEKQKDDDGDEVAILLSRTRGVGQSGLYTALSASAARKVQARLAGYPVKRQSGRDPPFS